MGILNSLDKEAQYAYLDINVAVGFEDQEPAYEVAKWYDLFWLLIPVAGFLLFIATVEKRYNNLTEKL